MVNKSKYKGDSEERAIVKLHRAEGYTCERTLESGARSDGSDTWDISLGINKKLTKTTPHGTFLKIECKIRKDGFKELYKWLGKNDVLTIRADHKERLYVIPESLWLELI